MERINLIIYLLKQLKRYDDATPTDKGRRFVDTRMDSIYHLGFGFRKNRIINEAYTPLGNVHILTLTRWLNEMLSKEDMAKLKSVNPIELGNLYTGTNLDLIIELLIQDKPSFVTTGRQYFQHALQAVYKMNLLIIHTMDVLGLDMNKELSYTDMKNMGAYLTRNFGGEWGKLRGQLGGMLGKPRLQYTTIGDLGGSGRFLNGLYSIGSGLTRNKRSFRGAPRVWEVANFYNGLFRLEELPEVHFRFHHPRKKYSSVVVNYGDVFTKAMEPVSKEMVKQKVNDYLNSIEDTNQELLENGNFESHSSIRRKYRRRPSVYVWPTNWQGATEVWRWGEVKASPTGGNRIELDARYDVDQLSQAFYTVKDRKYNLSLDAYARVKDTSDFQLLIDGKVVASFRPTEDWDNYVVQFIGKGGKQTVTIREVEAQNDGYGAIIDNVSIKLANGELSEEEKAKMQNAEVSEEIAKSNAAEQMPNVAKGKPTQQGSTGWGGYASKAVDGNTNGNYRARSVTHTKNNASQHWWQVDLGSNININKIKVFNRTDCCSQRLNGAKVYVGDRPYTGDLSTMQEVLTLTSNKAPQSTSLTEELTGRYVVVKAAGRNYLSLAEVEVFGTPAEE